MKSLLPTIHEAFLILPIKGRYLFTASQPRIALFPAAVPLRTDRNTLNVHLDWKHAGCQAHPCPFGIMAKLTPLLELDTRNTMWNDTKGNQKNMGCFAGCSFPGMLILKRPLDSLPASSRPKGLFLPTVYNEHQDQTLQCVSSMYFLGLMETFALKTSNSCACHSRLYINHAL